MALISLTQTEIEGKNTQEKTSAQDFSLKLPYMASYFPPMTREQRKIFATLQNSSTQEPMQLDRLRASSHKKF